MWRNALLALTNLVAVAPAYAAATRGRYVTTLLCTLSMLTSLLYHAVEREHSTTGLFGGVSARAEAAFLALDRLCAYALVGWLALEHYRSVQAGCRGVSLRVAALGLACVSACVLSEAVRWGLVWGRAVAAWHHVVYPLAHAFWHVAGFVCVRAALDDLYRSHKPDWLYERVYEHWPAGDSKKRV